MLSQQATDRLGKKTHCLVLSQSPPPHGFYKRISFNISAHSTALIPGRMLLSSLRGTEGLGIMGFLTPEWMEFAWDAVERRHQEACLLQSGDRWFYWRGLVKLAIIPRQGAIFDLFSLLLIGTGQSCRVKSSLLPRDLFITADQIKKVFFSQCRVRTSLLMD